MVYITDVAAFITIGIASVVVHMVANIAGGVAAGIDCHVLGAVIGGDIGYFSGMAAGFAVASTAEVADGAAGAGSSTAGMGTFCAADDAKAVSIEVMGTGSAAIGADAVYPGVVGGIEFTVAFAADSTNYLFATGCGAAGCRLMLASGDLDVGQANII